MTKCIVLGEEEQKKERRPISFDKALDTDPIKFTTSINNPSTYGIIELICRNYEQGTDLMFAYDKGENRSAGVLYLGQWNDGFVE